MSKPKQDLPQEAFADGRAFAAWIAQPGREAGLWVKLAKKASGGGGLTMREAVDVALCHGWIDGQSAPLDETSYLVRFTPRRARSKWSEINRARALELIEDGRMTPAGLAEVERARADGRWDAAYAPASRATLPDDLARALDLDDSAKAAFAGLDGQNRYAVLHRIQDAKKSATQAARIEKYVAMLSRGETIYPKRA